MSHASAPLVLGTCRRGSTRLTAVIGGLVLALAALFTSFAVQTHQVLLRYVYTTFSIIRKERYVIWGLFGMLQLRAGVGRGCGSGAGDSGPRAGALLPQAAGIRRDDRAGRHRRRRSALQRILQRGRRVSHSFPSLYSHIYIYTTAGFSFFYSLLSLQHAAGAMLYRFLLA